MNRVIASLTSLAAATSVSLAQHAATSKYRPHEPSGPEQTFAKLDKNHDGVLTLSELRTGPAGQKGLAKSEEYFNMLDKDDDGKLTLNEFLNRQPAQESTRNDTFKKLDTNADGSLSLDEFKASPFGQKNPAAADEYFNKLDQDSDGQLTYLEFTAHQPAPPPAQPAAPTTPSTPQNKVEVE